MPYDAIGNDALGMYRCFREAGYETSVLAARIHESYQSLARRVDLEPESTWSHPEDILIYHHGIEWEFGEFLLFRSKTKIVIKYHNITPPHFFEPYARNYFEGCKRGLEQTRRLSRHPTAWFWGDSSYNTDQLLAFGASPDRSRVISPCHCTEELACEPLDNSIVGAWRDSTVNLLFVGALRPNKGHRRALDVFAAYRHISGMPTRLFFVGNADPALSSYVNDVRVRLCPATRPGTGHSFRLFRISLATASVLSTCLRLSLCQRARRFLRTADRSYVFPHPSRGVGLHCRWRDLCRCGHRAV
jgi:glycosyltransferase involved in cell wall biosynthesis